MSYLFNDSGTYTKAGERAIALLEPLLDSFLALQLSRGAQVTELTAILHNACSGVVSKLMIRAVLNDLPEGSLQSALREALDGPDNSGTAKPANSADSGAMVAESGNGVHRL